MVDDEQKKAETAECQVPELPKVPDLYVNSTEVHVGGYDVTLRLAVNTPTDEGVIHVPVGRIRMNHAHAWTAAQLILRTLAMLVKEQGMFFVPPDIIERLELQDEYEALKTLTTEDEG